MRSLSLLAVALGATTTTVVHAFTFPASASTRSLLLRPSPLAAAPAAPAAAASPLLRRSKPAAARFPTSMRLNNNRYSDDVPLVDRALSATPYLLAVLDGVTYSKFLAFYAPDFFNPLYALLDPLLAVYKASPFVNLAIYLMIVWVGRQPSLSRYVRFNFQQAIILDVALVIPSILTSILREQSAPVWVQEPVANTLFFILSASLIYVLVKLALGEKPNGIPLVSEAAEMTQGPF